MNRNMRKMFTEEKISGLVKTSIEQGVDTHIPQQVFELFCEEERIDIPLSVQSQIKNYHLFQVIISDNDSNKTIIGYLTKNDEDIQALIQLDSDNIFENIVRAHLSNDGSTITFDNYSVLETNIEVHLQPII